MNQKIKKTTLVSICFCAIFFFPLSYASDASIYARLPAIADPEISPDGRHVAMFVEADGGYLLGVYALPITADSERYVKKYEDVELRWLYWANNDRLLVSGGFASKRGGTPVMETRLISLNYQLEDALDLVKKRPNQDRQERGLQIQDNVVSFLPHDPDHILMAFNSFAGVRIAKDEVRKVNVYTAKSELVQAPVDNIRYWETDLDGNLRIGYGVLNNRPIMKVRDSGSDEWRDMSHRIRSPEGKEADDDIEFVILGFDGDPNMAFGRSNHEIPRGAVSIYDVSRDEILEKMYGRDDVQISGLEYDSTRSKVIGVTYVTDVPEIHFFEQDADTALRDQISAQMDGARVVTVSSSYDNNEWILYISSPTFPGTYYVLDKSELDFQVIASRYPELPLESVLHVHATSYASRDGMEIPAYVTLPAGLNGLDRARNLPFVILPHGGPTSRDFRRFDFFAQFIASRGYGVLQMNFRGSGGYGADYRTAGYGEWGLLMQDDITDGVQWLIESSIADDSKICIVGWSYGAYAALMGAAKTPDLYQCAVGVAGVYDLSKLVAEAGRYIDGRYAVRHVQGWYRDAEQLRENSPNRRADDIQSPVLLFHGTHDRVVDASHSRLLHKALQNSGKKSVLIELDKGDHSLEQGSNRLTLLKELESFLKRHIG
jgi:dipeptidyl aminopeptidase/acylaminoacyl peptidase